MPIGRKRINVDLTPEARAGWVAMGRRTGGSFTAIAEVLGLAMANAVADDLKDKAWRQLAEQISATSFERGRSSADE
jgi:hypothetical protein